MKVFVINLDSNEDRLAHMRDMLGRIGLPFERVRAVKGSELSPADRLRDFDAARSRLAYHGEMRDGEIGCALSHLLVYARMIEQNIPIALILEDDVGLSPQFVRALDYAASRMDVAKPQVVLFSHNRVPKNPAAWDAAAEVEFRLQSYRSMTCADAYVITLPAAEMIRRVNYPVIVCSDDFRRWHRHYGLSLFRALPPTACQRRDEFRSEITGRGNEVRGLKRLWYMAKDNYLVWRDGK